MSKLGVVFGLLVLVVVAQAYPQHARRLEQLGIDDDRHTNTHALVTNADTTNADVVVAVAVHPHNAPHSYHDEVDDSWQGYIRHLEEVAQYEELRLKVAAEREELQLKEMVEREESRLKEVAGGEKKEEQLRRMLDQEHEEMMFQELRKATESREIKHLKSEANIEEISTLPYGHPVQVPITFDDSYGKSLNNDYEHQILRLNQDGYNFSSEDESNHPESKHQDDDIHLPYIVPDGSYGESQNIHYDTMTI